MLDGLALLELLVVQSRHTRTSDHRGQVRFGFSNDLSSVSAANNGETLRVGVGGSYELDEGDEVVVYEDVVNPAESGEFDVGMDVNYQSSGGEAATTLSVGSMDDDTSTTEMDGDDSDATETGESTADGSGGSLGFGVAAVAAAVAGLALVARVRN